mmetsp:Transcript_65840/g.155031  ORF Transcript_65840/g.155031 Transcript_65840/m.155031 type:complete len:221 (-) Transcript_65840:471-1133(-)
MEVIRADCGTSVRLHRGKAAGVFPATCVGFRQMEAFGIVTDAGRAGAAELRRATERKHGRESRGDFGDCRCYCCGDLLVRGVVAPTVVEVGCVPVEIGRCLSPGRMDEVVKVPVEDGKPEENKGEGSYENDPAKQEADEADLLRLRISQSKHFLHVVAQGRLNDRLCVTRVRWPHGPALIPRVAQLPGLRLPALIFVLNVASEEVHVALLAVSHIFCAVC